MGSAETVTPRPARLDETQAIAALAVAAYEPWVPIVGAVPEPMRADWGEVLRDHEVWVVDGPDASLVASLALALKPDHLLVWSVAVRPDHARRGLGRRLLSFAEQRARTLGRRELRLYTNVLMSRNIAIYERLGYRRTGTEDRGGGRIALHMAKRIVSPASGS